MNYLFRLFVAGKSANSIAAESNLREACKGLPEGSFKIEIVDVIASPKRALDEQVFVTPTLEIQWTNSKRRIIGTLQESAPLNAILKGVAH